MNAWPLIAFITFMVIAVGLAVGIPLALKFRSDREWQAHLDRMAELNTPWKEADGGTEQ
jgi:hypothetical protein